MLRDSRKASYEDDAVQLDYDMDSFCLLDMQFGMDMVAFSPTEFSSVGGFKMAFDLRLQLWDFKGRYLKHIDILLMYI